MSEKNTAWNNFVMNSEPAAYKTGSLKRAAAISNLYMGLANNGGINSFLTSSYDIDASEVLHSLNSIGAEIAARQFGEVLDFLNSPLPVSSSRERWDLLGKVWPEELDKKFDKLDILSTEADLDLLANLEKHVHENENFYLGLDS